MEVPSISNVEVNELQADKREGGGQREIIVKEIEKEKEKERTASTFVEFEPPLGNLFIFH